MLHDTSHTLLLPLLPLRHPRSDGAVLCRYAGGAEGGATQRHALSHA